MTTRPDPRDEPIDIEQSLRDVEEILASGNSPHDVFGRTSPTSMSLFNDWLAREEAKRKADAAPTDDAAKR